jgi:hydroxysqualene synthase
MTNNPSRSGKTHREENFPVASLLIRASHRPIILAFYYFVRAADDVADDPALTSQEKIDRLDRMEAALLGDIASDGYPQAAALRRALGERGLTTRHAQDLLKAFRLDAVKRRYADWNELISYCALSAMPVGRFVLDVHGESPSTWAASDAICAALQINNHLQDCGEDYRNLDRVYLPMDVMAAHGLGVEALGAKAALPALRSCIAELAVRTADLLRQGEGLIGEIADWRLRLEISVVHAFAMRITQLLTVRDPLSEETHLSKWQAGGIALLAALRGATRGFGPASRPAASGSRP